ncbi:hypothetical protein BH10BDE1_BH10BDE1_07180 [soil metagenome]
MRKFSRLLLTVSLQFGLFSLLFGVFAAPNDVLAQSGGGSSGGSEISLYLGSMLPNQIDGVTEVLPIFGGRYGMQAGSLGMAEFGLSNVHAEGVDFTTVSASLRADLPAMDGFFGIVYGGIDEHFYRPVGSDSRTTETGLHVGGGVMMHASDTLWFRGDLKFQAQPGTSLLFLFGFVFRAN